MVTSDRCADTVFVWCNNRSNGTGAPRVVHQNDSLRTLLCAAHRSCLGVDAVGSLCSSTHYQGGVKSSCRFSNVFSYFFPPHTIHG